MSNITAIYLNQNPTVPFDSPRNITATVVSPFAIAISWSPPLTPNGIIVNYTIYSNNIAVRNVDSSQLNYLLEGFSPGEQVSISVSASTRIGEGPRSEDQTINTQESGMS